MSITVGLRTCAGNSDLFLSVFLCLLANSALYINGLWGWFDGLLFDKPAISHDENIYNGYYIDDYIGNLRRKLLN
jgi:hypothetical protein